MRKLFILLAVLSIMMSCDLFAPDEGSDGGGTLTLADKLDAALYEVPESLRGEAATAGPFPAHWTTP